MRTRYHRWHSFETLYVAVECLIPISSRRRWSQSNEFEDGFDPIPVLGEPLYEHLLPAIGVPVDGYAEYLGYDTRHAEELTMIHFAVAAREHMPLFAVVGIEATEARFGPLLVRHLK